MTYINLIANKQHVATKNCRLVRLSSVETDIPYFQVWHYDPYKENIARYSKQHNFPIKIVEGTPAATLSAAHELLSKIPSSYIVEDAKKNPGEQKQSIMFLGFLGHKNFLDNILKIQDQRGYGGFPKIINMQKKLFEKGNIKTSKAFQAEHPIEIKEKLEGKGPNIFPALKIGRNSADIFFGAPLAHHRDVYNVSRKALGHELGHVVHTNISDNDPIWKEFRIANEIEGQYADREGRLPFLKNYSPENYHKENFAEMFGDMLNHIKDKQHFKEGMQSFNNYLRYKNKPKTANAYFNILKHITRKVGYKL